MANSACGVSAVPKSARRDHLEENLRVFDFTLRDEEMERISSLGRGLVSGSSTRTGRLLGTSAREGDLVWGVSFHL
ncbi:MAG: hypothetical protein BMS9Abin37_2911 [Acidobacteriota bacterium]|nr:MAG: hypothetical protein BMS9Abin37_2911 [Acidobacteriota bacterium]